MPDDLKDYPLGSNAFPVFDKNVQNLDIAINSEDDTWTDRTGKVRPTIKAAFDPTGLVQDAVDAADRAAAASDTAIAIANRYPDTATALSDGVIAYANLASGSGGTDGTFDLALSGGGGNGAVAKFVVSSGSVEEVVLVAKGSGYTSAPAADFSASNGLTGASVTPVIGPLVAEGGFFSIPDPAGKDAAVIYSIESGVAVEGARVPGQSAIRALDSRVMAISESNDRIGLIDAPVSGVGLEATTYVFERSVVRDGFLRKIDVYVRTAGTIKIKRFTKSGNIFTFVDEKAVHIPGTGRQVIDSSNLGDFAVSAGELIGFYAPTGMIGYVAGPADARSAWYGAIPASDVTTSFTDATVSNVTQMQIGFDIGAPVVTGDALLAVEESAVDSQTKLDILFSPTVIGREVPLVSGPQLGAYSWIFDSPVPANGRLTGWSIYGAKAGTITRLVLSRNGSTFTRVSARQVDIKLGLNTIEEALNVSEGQYLAVAFTSSGGAGAYLADVPDSVGWLYGSGTAESFTGLSGTTDSTLQLSFALSVLDLPAQEPAIEAAYPASLAGLTRLSSQPVVGAGDSLMVGVHGFATLQNQAKDCPPGMGSWFYQLRDALHRNDPFFLHADKMDLNDGSSGALISLNPATTKYTLPFNGIAAYFTPASGADYVEFTYKHMGAEPRAWIHTLLTSDSKDCTLDVQVNGVTKVSGFSTAPTTGNYAGLTPAAIEIPDVPNTGAPVTIRITNVTPNGANPSAGLYICGVSAKYSPIENTGYGGQASDWLLANLQARVLDYNPAITVFSIGANDEYKGLTPAQTEANINAIVTACRAHNPRMQMLFLGPPLSDESITPNSAMTATSRRIEKVCAQRGCYFLSLQRLFANVNPAVYRYDSIHLSKAGNTIVGQEIIRVVLGVAALSPELADANINYFNGATR